MHADVTFANGAQDRIGERMKCCIGIRMGTPQSIT